MMAILYKFRHISDLVGNALLMFIMLNILCSCSNNSDIVDISVDQEYQNLEFNQFTGSKVIEIKSSGAWSAKVEGNASWCTLSHQSGEGNQYVKVSVEPNQSDGDRTASVTIYASGSENVVINVKQFRNLLPQYAEAIEPDATGMSKDKSAMQLSQSLKMGFNIGNTYEAIYTDGNGYLAGDESSWGNPTPNAILFKAVKADGFDIVRMPLSFSHKLVKSVKAKGLYTDDTTYEIKKEWLDKIAKSVDEAIAEGLYVMINIHWDGGWMNHVNDKYSSAIHKRFEEYWKQIALRFRDYDEHLIFAGMNEVYDEDNNVWNVTPPEECFKVHNQLNQLFVNVVRATGGKNYYRYLVLQSYVTSIDYALSKFVMPLDVVKDRCFVESHYYDPYDFTIMADEGYKTEWGKPFAESGGTVSNFGQEDSMEKTMKSLSKFTSNNIPVIIGEWGLEFRKNLTPKEKLDRHIDSRNYYSWYIVKTCLNNKILPMNWDTGYLINRNTGVTNDALNLKAMNDAVQGKEYSFSSINR